MREAFGYEMQDADMDYGASNVFNSPAKDLANSPEPESWKRDLHSEAHRRSSMVLTKT